MSAIDPTIEVELPKTETAEAEQEEKDEAEAKPDDESPAEAATDDGKGTDKADKTEKSDALTVDLADDETDDALPTAPDKATAAFARLRLKEKEARQKLRESEAKAAQMAAALAARSEAESDDADPGPMPALKDSDWDEGEHAKAVLAWGEKKRSYDSKITVKRKAAEVEAKEWEATQAAYHDKRKAYLASHPDRLEEAESFVKSSFSAEQRAAIVDVLKDAPLMCIALAKNPDRAKSLANIQSMPRFVAELARMEAGMVVKKKPATQPEKKVTGAGEISSSATISRLEKEAERTGDYTKLFAFKADLEGKKKS